MGSDPLTPPQLAQMQEARRQHHQEAAVSQRQAAMCRQAQTYGRVKCCHPTYWSCSLSKASAHYTSVCQQCLLHAITRLTCRRQAHRVSPIMRMQLCDLETQVCCWQFGDRHVQSDEFSCHCSLARDTALHCHRWHTRLSNPLLSVWFRSTFSNAPRTISDVILVLADSAADNYLSLIS